jgi:hypothetical protein
LKLIALLAKLRFIIEVIKTEYLFANAIISAVSFLILISTDKLPVAANNCPETPASL